MITQDLIYRYLYIEEYVTIPKKEYEALKQLLCDLQAQVQLLQEEIRLLKNGKKATRATPPLHMT